MDEIGVRLLHLVPLVVFMASVYLAVHILFARYIRDPQSPVLWFFSVVTRPLMRPVRAIVPAGTPEARVRMLALVAYFALYMALWLVRAVVLARSGARG